MTLVFCSVSCWDAHQADARHRDAGAEEAKSPSQAVWAREQAEDKKRAATSAANAAPVTMKKVVGAASLDSLVVGSRFKEYIAQRARMATSERVLGFLSDHLRELCDQAIAAADKDGRRTVMDRDVLPLTTRGAASLATGANDPDDRPDEVLVVISKLKDYVRARSGMNTSDGVTAVFSAHLRRLARGAIRKAGTDDRKTVLDRDFVQIVKPQGS
jgi:histone H3/H4